TDMFGMFNGCSSLASLDLYGFNTSKVTDMSAMFGGCSSLTSLDVSNFNTSKVTGMSGMFDGCSSLTSLDVSNFNTSNVTDMNGMFGGCSSLTTIHCNDNWQSSLLNSSSGMFNGCTQLKGAVAYDADKIDAAMANPETGYFTRNGSNGIAAPEAEAAARRKGICTLSGVKMQGTFGSQPAGVYIVNGRKVVKR
ncbi:MAG: BspA family leucine-rich repeat surface protein, partial [Bacteroidaceae bacterium]|nr:BspA family leucine-rich repeat surface protein [Bacteroidaceae bacterium]